MAKPTGGDWGGIAILIVAAGHNIVAAGQQREMICGAVRRHHRERPVMTVGLAAWLLAHMFGVLPRWLDPLYWCGVVAEAAAELVRRCRGGHRC